MYIHGEPFFILWADIGQPGGGGGGFGVADLTCRTEAFQSRSPAQPWQGRRQTKKLQNHCKN